MARKTPEGRLKEALTSDLHSQFPGCVLLKNDEQLLQGVPDLLVLYRDRWAMLEVKIAENAARQPNQDYYVEIFNNMSFAAFVYPENYDHVLAELHKHFEA